MKVYGHRGARGEMPENTIPGFLHAAAAGVAGIETDIALTADLVPVLHHDPALADGRLICEVMRAEIAEVPSLAAALAAVPGVDWLLEIKTFPDTPGRAHSPAVVTAAVLKVLAEVGIAAEQVWILAFEWAVLREFAMWSSAYKRVCLTSPKQEAAREIWWGAGLEQKSVPAAVAEQDVFGWAGRRDGLNEALIAQAHELGLQVLAWTVNEAADLARLGPLVDGLITDFPARVMLGLSAA